MSAPLSTVRPRLTVAMIVRDAEHLLNETLNSALQICDELIVCDTGSKDSTCEMARRHRAQVIQRSWNDSFAEARNAAWESATGDWVLWLDAGERLATDQASALRSFIDSQADPARAYMMAIVVPPAAGEIAGEQVAQIRLVPNRKQIRFVGRVRETLKPSLAQAGIIIDAVPWRILRSERDTDPHQKRTKAVRNLGLLEKTVAEIGQTPDLLVALGEAMTTVGDTEGAIACFLKALQNGSRGSSIQREAYYGLLTALDRDSTQRQQQISVCLEALEHFPLDAQLLCAMGGYLQAEGRVDMAVRAYQTAFEYGQIDPELWHVGDILDIAAACLSLAHQLLNDDDGARRVLEKGLQRAHNSARLRRHLIDLHVKYDRRKEALAEFDLLPTETPHREALRSAIRGGCLASQQNWAPALAYLQTAYRAGCRDALCLRWLAVALIGTHDLASAHDVLTEWQTMEPRSAEVQQYLAAVHGIASAELAADGGDDRQLRFDTGAPSGQNVAPTPNLGTMPGITLYGPAGVKR